MTGPSPLRIALFSEVYWPMVSGVGVTLLRLTDALRARGHDVRVYSATYPLAPDEPDRPEVHRSPSVPLFLYPDVQWAFPRFRDVVDDLVSYQADVVHLATEFSLGITGSRQRGNSSCLSSPRLTPTTTSVPRVDAQAGREPDPARRAHQRSRRRDPLATWRTRWRSSPAARSSSPTTGGSSTGPATHILA